MRGTPMLKGVGKCLSTVYKHLGPEGRALVLGGAFGNLFRAPTFKGECYVMHLIFLHRVCPTDESWKQKRLYFRLGRHTISYGAKEFCLITGFNFGRNVDVGDITKVKAFDGSTFMGRVFPHRIPADLTLLDLETMLADEWGFRQLRVTNVVRVVLLVTLCTTLLPRDKCDKVTLPFIWLVEDLEAWNSFPWGTFLFLHSFMHLERVFGKIKTYNHSDLRNPMWYALIGFSTLFKMLPHMRSINAVRVSNYTPRMLRWDQERKILWTDAASAFNVDEVSYAVNNPMEPCAIEVEAEYYKAFKVYMDGNPPRVPSPLRRHLKANSNYIPFPPIRSHHMLDNKMRKRYHVGRVQTSMKQDFERLKKISRT